MRALALSVAVLATAAPTSALAQAGGTAAAPAEAPAEPPLVTVVPYGLLATSIYWNSTQLVNADGPFAVGAGDGASLGATARQSRLGLKVSSPPVASALSADSAGVVAEFDFNGGSYANNDVTWYQGHPRLRLFFAKVAWARVEVVAGQDWMIFAPQAPVSLVHLAVAAFTAAGNLYARLPQLRADAALGGLRLSGAVVAPVASGPIDPASPGGLTAVRTAGPADRSETPSLQGRVGYAIPIEARSLTFGVSGHFGRESAVVSDPTMPPLVRDDITSFGLALDAKLELFDWLTIQGEAFVGQNLDGFASNADVAGGEAVSVYGGWAQLSLKYAPFALNVGAGAEDPDPAEGARLPAGAVTRNAALFTSVTATAGTLTGGLELSQLWTRRAGTGGLVPGTQIAAAATFGF